MYRGKKIAVVVPAYNEEKLIDKTLLSIPDYVDNVYAVDDCSADQTGSIISKLSLSNKRIHHLSREENGGVGAAIVSGYKRALVDGNDIIAIMAGDNQMDPAYLSMLLDPIIDGRAELTKGNRLKPGYWREMSKWRLFGNILLNLLNKIASGYWNINDPQNGYVAISSTSLSKLDLDALYPRYAFENDMLIKSNVAGIHAMNVDIPARYGTEKSHIRYPSFTVKTSIFLLKSFLWRVVVKLTSHPHPIYALYLFGFFLTLIGGISLSFGDLIALPLGVSLFTAACIGEAIWVKRSVSELIYESAMGAK